MTTLTARTPLASARMTHRARRSFRAWRQSRPFWAGLWTMLAGVIITYIPSTGFRFVLSVTALWAGIAVGVMVGVFGLFLWIQPSIRYLLGVLILLFSMVSFITSDFGGFFIGMLLGITGGAMALSWTPKQFAPGRIARRKTAKRAVRITAAVQERVDEPGQIIDPVAPVPVVVPAMSLAWIDDDGIPDLIGSEDIAIDAPVEARDMYARHPGWDVIEADEEDTGSIDMEYEAAGVPGAEDDTIIDLTVTDATIDLTGDAPVIDLTERAPAEAKQRSSLPQGRQG